MRKSKGQKEREEAKKYYGIPSVNANIQIVRKPDSLKSQRKAK